MIRLLLFLSFFILFHAAPMSADEIEEYFQKQEKTVYLVTSYNDNNEWNRRVRAALIARLHESGFLVNFRSVYMDANGLMSKPARKKVVQSYLDGVNEIVDVFIATDFGATETMLSFTPEERAHIPLVFVSEFAPYRFPDSIRSATGGISEIPFEKTFQHARKMLPATKNVYVWSDKTQLGRLYLREAKKQLSKYENEFTITYGVDALNSEQILKQAAELPENSFVIFCQWLEDDTHHYHNPAYFYPLLTKTSNAPMFTIVDNYVRDGFVGGETISPKAFAELAAKKAIAILNGNSPNQLPLEAIPSQQVFNQKTMARWNLPESEIPDKARVIDWKISAHKQYRNQLKLIQGVFAFLVVAILLMMLLYWQRQSRLKASLFREKLLKQTKDKLRFKSEILSNTISSLKEGMVTIDAEMHVLECNEIFCSLVEMPHDEIIGKHIHSICEFSNSEGLEARIKDICNGVISQTTIEPTFLISCNGISRYIEGQALSLFGNTEQNKGAILLVYDVLTEMRQQKIRSISLDALNAYTWFYDLNTGELVFGDGFPKTYLDPAQLNTLKKFAENIHPLDRTRFLEFFESKTQQENDEFSITYRIDFSGSGHYEWWECRGIMEYSQLGTHTIAYLYGLHLSIDKHKESEQKTELTRQLFSIVGEAAKIGYAKYNLHTGKGFAMPQWFKNLELSSENREDFDFRETFNYVSADQRYDLLKFYVKAMCRQETEYRGDKRIVTDSGNIKWLHGHMLVLENAEGELELIEVTYDITEQKHVEKDLILSKNKAESANQLKSAFLANMSHEIRTPLNAIVGFCDLLMADECSEEERNAYGKVILANNELLLQLINDILDLSKIEAGFIDFKLTDFDLSEFLGDIRLVFESRVPAGVKFVTKTPDKHYSIRMDREKLTQVINNFVNNAIKFTSQGFIEIGYEIKESELEIYVADSGIGIRPEDCGKVFDRFEKLNSLAPGTGLGLSICKAIIDAAGGKIEVDSVYEKGSTFRVLLPLDVVDPACQIDFCEVVDEPVVIPENTDNQNIRILVAEDIDSNYLLMENILRDYTLIRAHNGDEAVDRIQEDNYDLVLMDMKMPGMDGMDAARLIREFNTEIPIIAVTAYVFEADRQRIMEAGCNAFIPKPFNRHELVSTVKTLLAKQITEA
ncbi:MAG: response regulator [Bacteroidales bacterium]